MNTQQTIRNDPDVSHWQPLNEKTGPNNWKDCLDYTLHDNDYFVKHRKGNTKFLNVLQGNNEEQADIWYDAATLLHLKVGLWLVTT